MSSDQQKAAKLLLKNFVKVMNKSLKEKEKEKEKEKNTQDTTTPTHTSKEQQKDTLPGKINTKNETSTTKEVINPSKRNSPDSKQPTTNGNRAKKQKTSVYDEIQQIADVCAKLYETLPERRADLIFSKIFERATGNNIYEDLSSVTSTLSTASFGSSGRQRDSKGRYVAEESQKANEDTNPKEDDESEDQGQKENEHDKDKKTTEQSVPATEDANISSQSRSTSTPTPTNDKSLQVKKPLQSDGASSPLPLDLPGSSQSNTTTQSDSSKLDIGLFQTFGLFNQ
jgi:hypothetical protein